jgi:Leucine-rich repeat (LRR) protein
LHSRSILHTAQVLTFNDNELNDLPDEIYQLDNLRLFGLDHNPLENIPADIVQGGSQQVSLSLPIFPLGDAR